MLLEPGPLQQRRAISGRTPGNQYIAPIPTALPLRVLPPSVEKELRCISGHDAHNQPAGNLRLQAAAEKTPVHQVALE